MENQNNPGGEKIIIVPNHPSPKPEIRGIEIESRPQKPEKPKTDSK